MPVDFARIVFAGNPWPKGHGIKEAAWMASLREDGLRFHPELESADYYAEGRGEGSEDRDWTSPGVWHNYHACRLSSYSGFTVATPESPIDLDALEGRTFHVDSIQGDSLPHDFVLDDLTFQIYLLGHDSACDHAITFAARRGPRTYDVHWRGRIALTYAGDYDLEHSFEATLPALRLDTIKLVDVEPNAANTMLASVVRHSERWNLEQDTFVPADPR